MAFLAQSVEKPRGEASVVFESAGGKWQKVLITDQSNGESSVAYSLDAEPSVADTATERHPRIAFTVKNQASLTDFGFAQAPPSQTKLPVLLLTPSAGPSCLPAATINKLKHGLRISQEMGLISLWIKE
jgi:hypothetical protein